MQDTRQRILKIIEERGEATVKELSEALGLTSVTIRHHLEILKREGYVSAPQIRRSSRPGRPRYVYCLAPRAIDLFPSNYNGLAESLLAALESHLPQEERRRILETVGRAMAAQVGPLPKEQDARIQAVLDYMKQLGFTARAEKVEEGRYRLYISHCPYRRISRAHPETCYVDETMLTVLTGGHLHRLSGERAGEDHLCSYEIDLSD